LQDFAPVFGFAADDPVQGTDLPALDFVGLAQAQGCSAMWVSDAAALRDALQLALTRKDAQRPMLIEIEVA